jgi:pSer/pThr/pTyr-binding forkhead associated (FHA) protein
LVLQHFIILIINTKYVLNMEKTIYQQTNGTANATPSFQPQSNGANVNKTIYPGMQQSNDVGRGPVGVSASVHNTPIAGFLYSVSRTIAGEYWPIYEGPNKIGRAVDSIVQLNDPQVSDKHATLVVRPMYNNNQKMGILVYIQDDASTCGTMLNGSSLGFEPKECHHGDVITIGPNYELYLILVDATSIGLQPKEALQNIAPVVPTAAPAPAPSMNPGWGSAQPGMSSSNGPKGTLYQPMGNVATNPLSDPDVTVYMPSK